MSVYSQPTNRKAGNLEKMADWNRRGLRHSKVHKAFDSPGHATSSRGTPGCSNLPAEDRHP